LEDERRKLGDEHTSDRFSLELEIERVKRDLINAEDQLEGARRDLTKRDLEVAQMVSPFLLSVLLYPCLPPCPFPFSSPPLTSVRYPSFPACGDVIMDLC
jgi:hypothetical protein